MIFCDFLMLAIFTLLSWSLGAALFEKNWSSTMLISLILITLYTGTIMFNVYQFDTKHAGLFTF